MHCSLLNRHREWIPSAACPQERIRLDNNELTRLFAAAGARHGFDDVRAEFAAFQEFKVRWTRNYRWATFEVSDYLIDSPPEVMSALANTIFSKILGEDMPYPDIVCNWLTSEGFVRSKQQTYIRRFTGFMTDPSGRVRNLEESRRRLEDRGLLVRDPDAVIGWIKSGTSRAVGRSSILMKVVAISTTIDDDEVGEDLFDYCVFSQLARVGMGYDPVIKRRGAAYDAILSKYPDRKEMEYELRRLNLHI